MNRKHSSTRIQKKILLITLSCILGMCVIIATLSNIIFHNYLQTSLLQSTEINLQFLSDNMNNHVTNVYQLVRFCQTNQDIATYIEHNPNPSSVLSISTHNRLSEEVANNTSQNYIPRVAVVTNEHFLQVVSTAYSSTADIAKEAPLLPYFDTLINSDSYNYSIGIVNDPFYTNRQKQVLPIIRPITHKYNSIQGGYVLLEISADLFSEPLKNYTIAPDSHMYFTFGEHTYLYQDGLFVEQEIPYEIIEDLSDSLLQKTTSAYRITSEVSGENLVLSTPLALTDCYITQTISKAELTNQQVLYLGILFLTFVLLFAIGIILTYILNRIINVPVQKLRAKMDLISQGNFSRDTSIEWNHELGDIGRGINDMSENIVQLMDNRLESEKQKKDLEYKMLQSQINPHFLYNTLNSIKWMATIQNATGIAEMTTALSRLMKSISKGTKILVPISEELALIQDYFTIQQYRYGGTISLSIDVTDERLYDCAIIKFTLQPLVENSIFHGIEPKGTAGSIKILISLIRETDIIIEITDDGVGMSSETAAKILTDNSESTSDFFREIGVSSVQKRIQYEFGEAYGITITSVEKEYTTMTIHIPYQPLLETI